MTGFMGFRHGFEARKVPIGAVLNSGQTDGEDWGEKWSWGTLSAWLFPVLHASCTTSSMAVAPCRETVSLSGLCGWRKATGVWRKHG